MRTFAELEDKEKRRSIGGIRDGESASGFLILDGKDTSAVLVSSWFLGFRSSETGWFDVILQSSNGSQVLLHNALTTQSISQSRAGENLWEEHIYPNLIVFNPDALTDEHRVKTIAFSLDKLGTFFHYQQIEWQPLFDPSKEVMQGLKMIRRGQKRAYDFFDPASVYIVHRPKRAISIKALGRTYRIDVGLTGRGLGWDHVTLNSTAIAEITFDEPVTLDDAIDAVWGWKRFFSILGLNPLSVTAMAATGKKGGRAKQAEFYMPNHRSWPTAAEGMFRLHPGDVPLNTWKDRKVLSALMKRWLELEPERGLFRGAMGNVIDDMTTRTSTEDIVMLCAGVETLSELDDTSPISKTDLRRITNAAVQAIDVHKIAVSKARVGTVLGQLRRQSLPQRLRQIFSALGDFLPESDARRLEAAIIQVRSIAAHGHGYTEASMRLVEPTVSGLLSACALYDLVTCGFDHASGVHRRRLEWAVAGLRQFDKKRASSDVKGQP